MAKVLEFIISISPSNDYSGLISIRMDWFDLLAVQGMLESSPAQFKSINSSALSFLYSPKLTSIYDYWKHHSFDPRRRSVAAGRRHPESEVRGGGREELPRVRGQGWQPREAILRMRSVVAGRRHPASEVRDGSREELLCPRPGEAAERSNPRSGGCAGIGGPRGAIIH